MISFLHTKSLNSSSIFFIINLQVRMMEAKYPMFIKETTASIVRFWSWYFQNDRLSYPRKLENLMVGAHSTMAFALGESLGLRFRCWSQWRSLTAATSSTFNWWIHLVGIKIIFLRITLSYRYEGSKKEKRVICWSHSHLIARCFVCVLVFRENNLWSFYGIQAILLGRGMWPYVMSRNTIDSFKQKKQIRANKNEKESHQINSV